jgi:hypothetical protein
VLIASCSAATKLAGWLRILHQLSVACLIEHFFTATIRTPFVRFAEMKAQEPAHFQRR